MNEPNEHRQHFRRVVLGILLLLASNALATRFLDQVGWTAAGFLALPWWLSFGITTLFIAVFSFIFAPYRGLRRYLTNFLTFTSFKVACAVGSALALYIGVPHEAAVLLNVFSRASLTTGAITLLHLGILLGVGIGMSVLRGFALALATAGPERPRLRLPDFEPLSLEEARETGGPAFALAEAEPDVGVAGLTDRESAPSREEAPTLPAAEEAAHAERAVDEELRTALAPQPAAADRTEEEPAPATASRVEEAAVSAHADTAQVRIGLGAPAEAPVEAGALPPTQEPAEKPAPTAPPDVITFSVADVLVRLAPDDLAYPVEEIEERWFRDKRITVPAHLIAPQLTEGHVLIDAAQVLSQIPSACFKRRTGDIIGRLPQGRIELPLERIIAQFPADFLSVEHARSQETLEEEIPTPFEMPGQPTALPSTASRQQEPSAAPDVTLPTTEPAAAVPGERVVLVSAERLLEQVPKHFICPSFSTLTWESATPGRIGIPFEYVLPQLGEGRIDIDFLRIVHRFPKGAFVAPTEEIISALPSGRISLPLDEVIAQVPAELLTKPAGQAVQPVAIDGVPEVFQEAQAAPFTPAPAAAPPRPAPESQTPVFVAPEVAGTIDIDWSTLLPQIPNEALAFSRDRLVKELAGRPFRLSGQIAAEQIAEGAVIVPLRLVLSQMPDNVLDGTLDSLDQRFPEVRVQMPLDQVVAAMPAQTLSAPTLQQPEVAVEEIPSPFEDLLRDKAAVAPTPAVPPAVVEAPAEAPAQAPVEAPAEVSTATATHVGLSTEDIEQVERLLGQRRAEEGPEEEESVVGLFAESGAAVAASAEQDATETTAPSAQLETAEPVLTPLSLPIDGDERLRLWLQTLEPYGLTEAAMFVSERRPVFVITGPKIDAAHAARLGANALARIARFTAGLRLGLPSKALLLAEHGDVEMHSMKVPEGSVTFVVVNPQRAVSGLLSLRTSRSSAILSGVLDALNLTPPPEVAPTLQGESLRWEHGEETPLPAEELSRLGLDRSRIFRRADGWEHWCFASSDLWPDDANWAGLDGLAPTLQGLSTLGLGRLDLLLGHTPSASFTCSIPRETNSCIVACLYPKQLKEGLVRLRATRVATLMTHACAQTR